ncbi:hypothetical protein [Microbacterium sp. GXF7504]
MTTTTETTPAEPAAASARRTPPRWVMLAGLTAGLGVILVVLLLVFIMPSLKSGPHGLPLGVVGAPAVVEQVETGLESAAPGAYTTESFASEGALRSAIQDRDVVGGVVVDQDGVHTLVASAGSAVISATVTATGEALAAATGVEASVTDVVPLPETDPSGVGIGGLAFPLVFGGIVPAVAFRKVFAKSLGWAVAGIVTFAAVGGVAVAAVLAFLFGSIAASAFWPVAAAMALGIAGLALPLAGLQELFGGKGFTIGAMVMMFVGNPLAGISTTGAWLPTGLGLIGQLLPPGASGTLVRSAAYFGWAGGLTAGLTLAVWVLAGVLLLVVGAARSRRRAVLEVAQAA